MLTPKSHLRRTVDPNADDLVTFEDFHEYVDESAGGNFEDSYTPPSRPQREVEQQ